MAARFIPALFFLATILMVSAAWDCKKCPSPARCTCIDLDEDTSEPEAGEQEKNDYTQDGNDERAVNDGAGPSRPGLIIEAGYDGIESGWWGRAPTPWNTNNYFCTVLDRKRLQNEECTPEKLNPNRGHHVGEYPFPNRYPLGDPSTLASSIRTRLRLNDSTTDEDDGNDSPDDDVDNNYAGNNDGNDNDGNGGGERAKKKKPANKKARKR